VAFEIVERDEWAARRDPTWPLPEWPGGAADLDAVELRDVYAPLAGMVAQRSAGDRATAGPFVVGISGSVAAGKSTSARALAALLEAHDAVGPGRVAQVSTDGFLFPNLVLEARGILERKGFPESFDTERLRTFLGELRSGRAEVRAPVYSHERYDVTDEELVVRDAAVVVLEGLPVVDDPADLALYLHAEESDLEAWYIARFLALRREALDDDSSFFRLFAAMDEADAEEIAHQVWTHVNLVNLREHILPARDRADVVFEQGPDHAVRRVCVRR
jgi:type I pantothenate kinase